MSIKSYWNIARLFCSCIIYGKRPRKSNSYHLGPLRKKLADP